MYYNRSFSFLCVLLLLTAITSCDKIEIPREELTPDYNQVYMAAAARNPNRVNLKMDDAEYNITYGASFGGYGTAAQDIQLSFESDPVKAQAYNTANGTSYPLLPAVCYELKQPSAMIPKGSLSTVPLSIMVNPSKGMDLFKDYILAVTIKEVSEGVKVNETLRTAYYIVRGSLNFADFPDINRSGWAIASASSEEPAEGATNGGMGIHVIDGLNTTFWHSQWDGGFSPPPHFLVVDMGKSELLHGLAFTGRQSSNTGKPRSVLVELSVNGSDWINAGTVDLQNSNPQQKVFLPAALEGRYLKLTIVSNYGNEPFTHLAELGAF